MSVDWKLVLVLFYFYFGPACLTHVSFHLRARILWLKTKLSAQLSFHQTKENGYVIFKRFIQMACRCVESKKECAVKEKKNEI